MASSGGGVALRNGTTGIRTAQSWRRFTGRPRFPHRGCYA
jgi:hypothetical protein